MIRFQVRLDDASFNVLRSLSEQEYRDPRIQAAVLIRESLIQRGLMSEQGDTIEAYREFENSDQRPG